MNAPLRRVAALVGMLLLCFGLYWGYHAPHRAWWKLQQAVQQGDLQVLRAQVDFAETGTNTRYALRQFIEQELDGAFADSKRAEYGARLTSEAFEPMVRQVLSPDGLLRLLGSMAPGVNSAQLTEAVSQGYRGWDEFVVRYPAQRGDSMVPQLRLERRGLGQWVLIGVEFAPVASWRNGQES